MEFLIIPAVNKYLHRGNMSAISFEGIGAKTVQDVDDTVVGFQVLRTNGY